MGTVALGNAAVLPLCLHKPISGDLAAFRINFDELTAERKKCR